ncbi:hypothetical protein PM082_010173 [Marasmius tenuissimus]|nr:hypothetical protein PM082_010173 [Marasmius tenuissimus]
MAATILHTSITLLQCPPSLPPQFVLASRMNRARILFPPEKPQSRFKTQPLRAAHLRSLQSFISRILRSMQKQNPELTPSRIRSTATIVPAVPNIKLCPNGKSNIQHRPANGSTRRTKVNINRLVGPPSGLDQPFPLTTGNGKFQAIEGC